MLFVLVSFFFSITDRFGIKPSICEKSPRKPAPGLEVADEDEEEVSRMKVNTAENFVKNSTNFFVLSFF